MRRNSRSVVVAVLTALLFMNPAIACHNCGSYWGGYSDYGYYNSGYVSYGHGGYYDSYDGCCGGGVVVDDGCGDCDCGDCGCGCGGYDGCDCGSCDGCVGCGDGEVMHEEMHGEMHPQMHEPMTAPEPPAYQPPASVNKPNVAPALPPETAAPPIPTYSAPPATPAEVPPAATVPDEEMPAMSEPFGEPSAMEPPAAETPAAEAPADDLFGAPAESTAPPATEAPTATEPAAPAAEDDLFGAPAAEPESTQTPPTTEEAAPADDLFGPPADEAAPPAEAPAEEVPATDTEDDLFGDAGSILRQPGGFASLELRRWKDNTGRHSCRGRLLRMYDGKVQLIKDNGRTSTVPLARLSVEDLAFVNRQASAQHNDGLDKTAQVGMTH